MFDEKEFRVCLVRNNMSMKELAGRLDMDESTLYRKVKAGGTFTRREINEMIDILSIKEPMKVFFARELA